MNFKNIILSKESQIQITVWWFSDSPYKKFKNRKKLSMLLERGILWVDENIVHLYRAIGYVAIDVYQHSLKYLRYIHFTVHGFYLKKSAIKIYGIFFFLVILVEYTRAGKSKLFFEFHTESIFFPI